MMPLRLYLAVLLLAFTAGAQEVTTALVPVVGSVFGAGMSRWRTDVEIYNPSPFPAEIAIDLPSLPGTLELFFSLPPGERLLFPDIIVQNFGLEHALSPLRVTSDRFVSVRAVAHATWEGTTSPRQVIPVYATATWFPLRVLEGLAFSEEERTNIGLVNLGEQDATFILALQRIPGRNLAISTVTVGPGGIRHDSIQSLFPTITTGHGFRVVVETPFPSTHVYASVIESRDNAGRFVVPGVGAR